MSLRTLSVSLKSSISNFNAYQLLSRYLRSTPVVLFPTFCSNCQCNGTASVSRYFRWRQLFNLWLNTHTICRVFKMNCVNCLILLQNSANTPAAQLHGNGKFDIYKTGIMKILSESIFCVTLWLSYGLFLCWGSLVTDWYTGSGQWYSPILRGGMRYNGGYITVPKQGLYYIYAKIYFDPRTGIQGKACSFYIYSNTQIIDMNQKIHQAPSTSGNQGSSRFSGLLKMMNKGDRLFLKFYATCYYNMYSYFSQFGAFLVA